MTTEHHPAARRGFLLHTPIRRLSTIRWPVPVFTVVFTLLPLLTSCSDSTGPESPAIYARGEIISIEHGLGYTRSQTLGFPAQIGTALPDSQRFGLDTWSITCMSADTAGNPQVVSGALIVPRTDEARSLLSIQHGTQTRRTLVASSSPAPMLSPEGQIGLIMASFGYLIVVPDYPGFGVSEIPHPYLHADSLTPCVIDGLRAARNWAEENDFTLDAVDAFTARGVTDIELTSIPGGDHETAGLPAILAMIEWFAEIRDEYGTAEGGN